MRTLTAGTPLMSLTDLHAVESALDFLAMARQRFEATGYEVQTVRVALNPLLGGKSSAERMKALKDLRALDALDAVTEADEKGGAGREEFLAVLRTTALK